ncbi:MAG: hypothetical protein R2867_06275 [Caldilineaceae bacterium]
MTTTSVERLEGAKFGIPLVMAHCSNFNVPEKYNLKYVFSNDNFYDPLLFFYGWHRIGPLENDIIVWEREDIPVLPEVLPRREVPLYHRVMFGISLAALAAIVAANHATIDVAIATAGGTAWYHRCPCALESTPTLILGHDPALVATLALAATRQSATCRDCAAHRHRALAAALAASHSAFVAAGTATSPRHQRATTPSPSLDPGWCYTSTDHHHCELESLV